VTAGKATDRIFQLKAELEECKQRKGKAVAYRAVTEAEITRLKAEMRKKCNGSLELLRDANILREKEWDPESKISVLFHGNELAGEVGEACNIIKKLERERMGIRGTRATITELAGELADVVIVADLIALHSGIDLGQAVIDKFNATSTKYGLSVTISHLPKEKEDK
jgi:NTP pyrophosphatase (non-canonical NTP hydrolase)